VQLFVVFPTPDAWRLTADGYEGNPVSMAAVFVYARAVKLSDFVI
jgi:hypothetical protein